MSVVVAAGYATGMPSLEPRGAILDPEAAARAFVITRYPPGPALAPFVRHYWFIRWDLRGREPHTQGVLSLPAVNVVFEPDRDGVYGVPTARGERVLEGAGRVFGVNFRSGGFQPFLGRSMHELTDRVVPIRSVFSGDVEAVRRDLYGTDDPEAQVARLEGFLNEDRPAVDPLIAVVDAVVERARTDPAMIRVEDLAAGSALSVRSLQRLLRYRVGVGPKWLLRLFRLHDAADRLASGAPLDQATFARALGYYDQAHFVRDFVALTGCPPARYAALCEARRAG